MLQAAKLGLQVPPVCACNVISPFNPAYPFYCHANCPLHYNTKLYEERFWQILNSAGLL